MFLRHDIQYRQNINSVVYCMYVYQISNTLPSKHAIYIEMKYMTDFEGYSLSLNALLNVVIFSNKFLSEDKPLTCINDAIK